MAENYSFFDSKDHDRKYNARHWADYFFPFFRTGVFNGDLQVVENGGMSVKIKPGYAWIDGYGYHLKGEDLVIDLEMASGNMNRADSIVIRLDLTNRWIKGFCKTGNYYAGTPAPPEPEISATIHEIVIARISVAAGVTKITQDMITDTRMDQSICGWVCGAVEQIDFSQINAQFESFFSNYRSNIQTQYGSYLESIRSLEAAGQNRYNNMAQEFTEYENQQKETITNLISSYETWLSETEQNGEQNIADLIALYDSWIAQQEVLQTQRCDRILADMEALLEGDAAAKLQLEINAAEYQALLDRLSATNKTTEFQADGSILETAYDGSWAKQTVFEESGNILETYTDDRYEIRKVTEFREDGTIEESYTMTERVEGGQE